MLNLKIENYRAFFIDLDGVLVRDSEPLFGAVDFLQKLKEIGEVNIFSNNSTRSRESFSAHLLGLGFSVEPKEVVNSAYIVSRYLLEKAGPARVFVIGEEGLKQELELSGHRLVNPKEAQFLVVGMDRKLTYGKLSQALNALLQGAEFIASNDDSTFPTPNGLTPGSGAIVGAIKGMGYAPKEVVGKPSPIAMEVAMETVGIKDPKKCLLIGDRLETDILAANQAGMNSVMVLTGVTSREDLKESDIQPTWIIENLTKL